VFEYEFGTDNFLENLEQFTYHISTNMGGGKLELSAVLCIK